MNSTFQEVHTDLSRSTTVGVSYKNTFLMEINDLKTKKVCPTFKFPALAKLQEHIQSLCILNSFSSFLLILPWL